MSFFSFEPDKKTITTSAGNSFLMHMVIKMKGIITMPILTYFMVPNEMGLYNFVIVTAAMIMPFFTLNLPDGSVIFFAREKSEKKIKTMYMTVVNSIIVNVFFFTSLLVLYLMLFKPHMPVSAFWILMVLYVQILYKLPEFILVIYQKTTFLLKHGFVRDVGISVLSIILVIIGYSYKGIIFANFVFFLVVGLFLLRKIFQNMTYSFRISFTHLKSFLKMSIPLFPVFFFSWVIRSSDSYFLIYLKGEDVLGKYSVIYGLCNIILVLTFALNFFWFPVSAKLWIENREKYRRAYISIFAAFITVLFFAVLLFELNSKIIMHLLVRRTEYHDAYIIFGIISFAFSMQVLITLLTAPLYSNKNPNMILLSYLAGGILNAILNFVLIPPMGLLGAAISTAFSYLVIVILMSFLNYKIAKFSFFDKRLVYIGPIFIVMWVIVTFIRDIFSGVQILLADIVLILFAGSLLYFKVLTREEKSFIFSFIREFGLKRFGKK